ncbi:DUF6931 family protein [Sphingomonas sp. DT-51]|uniref:DUF6931 family protein n=1 Tax=Sphingomonas sp. DT-51 TaxID=3396165 RepID=UPI003F1BFCFD
MDWINTVWTEARQVTAFLEWPRMEGDDAPPARFFEQLRSAGRHEDAAAFLALALPRDAAVRWLRDVALATFLEPEAPTWHAVDNWMSQPSDASRRAAFDAALASSARDYGAVAAGVMLLCGTAVFFSGGSLAGPNAVPVPASKQATGQFVAEGIRLCAAAAVDPVAALDRALLAGAALAAHGMDMP